MSPELDELRTALDDLSTLALARCETALRRLAPPDGGDAALAELTARAERARLKRAERDLHAAAERHLAIAKPQAGALRETLAVLHAVAAFYRVDAAAEALEREAATARAETWPGPSAALEAAGRAGVEDLRGAYRRFAARDVAAAEAAYARRGADHGERAPMRDALRLIAAEPARAEAGLALLLAFAAVDRLRQEAGVMLELTSYIVFGQTFTERLTS